MNLPSLRKKANSCKELDVSANVILPFRLLRIHFCGSNIEDAICVVLLTTGRKSQCNLPQQGRI